VALEITKEAELIIRLPIRFPESHIEKILAQKRVWIDRHLNRLSLNKPKKFNLEDGSFLPLLGNDLEISHEPRASTISLEKNKIIVPLLPIKQRSDAIIFWYKQQAHQILRKKVEIWGETMATTVKGITISSALTRWGSCNYKNSLSFTWRLITAPEHVVDYVVVHELAHTKHKNHGPKFWMFVEYHYPLWRESKAWLKNNGHTLPKKF
jgi:predicted metal-dependent hydrolase